MNDHAVSVFLTRPREPQVFVDPTGRRARTLRLAVLAIGMACALWLAGLGAGVVGFNGLPSLPLLHAGKTGVATPVSTRLATTPPARS